MQAYLNPSSSPPLPPEQIYLAVVLLRTTTARCVPGAWALNTWSNLFLLPLQVTQWTFPAASAPAPAASQRSVALPSPLRRRCSRGPLVCVCVRICVTGASDVAGTGAALALAHSVIPAAPGRSATDNAVDLGMRV